MQVSVETTQGLERRVSITVPAAAISVEVEKELRTLAKTRRIISQRDIREDINVDLSAI